MLDNMQQPRDLPKVYFSLGLDPSPPLLWLPLGPGLPSPALP